MYKTVKCKHLIRIQTTCQQTLELCSVMYVFQWEGSLKHYHKQKDCHSLCMHECHATVSLSLYLTCSVLSITCGRLRILLRKPMVVWVTLRETRIQMEVRTNCLSTPCSQSVTSLTSVSCQAWCYSIHISQNPLLLSYSSSTSFNTLLIQ